MDKRQCLTILYLALASSLCSQALFELPDSLQVKDTVYVAQWPQLDYVDMEDSLDVFQRHLYRAGDFKDWAAMDLGNNGSEAFETTFSYDRDPGFRVGYDAMSPYRWEEKDLRFYKANVAISNVFASLGTSFANSNASLQQNAQLEAFFTRSFANRVNASLDYRSINEVGIYTRDQSRHTQLHLQVNQHSSTGRFFWYAAWRRNVFNRQSNGGIEEDALLSDINYVIRENMPIALSNAGSRDEENAYTFGWRYRLAGDGRNQLDLNNTSSYQERRFKFYVNNASQLDSFYSRWRVHPTGIRNAFDHRAYSNKTELSWASNFFDEITAGYRFSFNKWDNENLDQSFVFGTLYGRLNWTYRDNIELAIKADLETLEEAGDFDLEGRLALEWPGVGSVNAMSALGLQSPSRQEEELVLNGSYLIDASLPSNTYFQLEGSLNIETLGITLKAAQYLSDNLPYFDSDFEVQTTEVAISSFELEWQWKLGSFFGRNAAVYQVVDQDVLPLPEWQMRHILFYEGKIRKNGMTYRIGVEGRFWQMDNAPRFAPVNGRFIPSEVPVGNNGLTYSIDPYAQFDIQTFSIFFKGERLQSTWLDVPFIPIVHRPQFDWVFRLGIRWKFID